MSGGVGANIFDHVNEYFVHCGFLIYFFKFMVSVNMINNILVDLFIFVLVQFIVNCMYLHIFAPWQRICSRNLHYADHFSFLTEELNLA